MNNALSVSSLLDLSHTVAASLFDDATFPWEVLPKISEFILTLGPTLDENIFEKRGENIWVARSAKIAPTASLNGPLIIDEDAEIRHCAFIRGSAIIGKGAVIGNSTEVKNAVIFDKAQVPHYNYVGDSVLGFMAHMGAGAVTSNLKSDKSNVTVLCNGERVVTGLKKFGAILGNRADVGCNSVLCPGSVLGEGCRVYPLSLVRGHVPENHIYKNKSEIV
ncbi:MAG: UDP-N-acetylglucosamine pyrophosphorylase, partial [Clostridia bacterium]|nr:UDP-N-acetylglucosamine pyrophosphorylase [Clostridia bacterium]